jgi:hypothetical protein
MKRYLSTLIVLICLTIEGSAQLSVSGAPPGVAPTFTTTVPSGLGFPNSIMPGLLPDGSNAPVSCLFMEYGDGRFTTRFSTDYKPIPTSGNLNALMTFRGKYDGGHPTARIISQQYTIPSNTAINQKQNDLPVGKNIMIRSDVIDLLELDTIQVVLTFKKNFSKRGKLIFYYKDALLGFDIVDPVLFNNNGASFQQVRTYNPKITHCINVQSPSQLNSLSCPVIASNKMIDKINAKNSTIFKGITVFDIDNNLPMDEEFNVFITLVTNMAIKTSEKAFTALRAYIIPDEMDFNGTLPGSSSPDFSEMIFSTIPFDPSNSAAPRPHDPNYIISKEKCLKAAECNPNSAKDRVFVPKEETIDYKVHFQNDGIGPADSITVYVYFLTPNFNVDTKNSITNITANVAGRNIVGENLEYFVEENVKYQVDTKYGNSQFSKKPIPTSFQHLKVVKFILKNLANASKEVNLLGGGDINLPNGNINPSTNGEINFTVKTLKSLPCYSVKASIYFKKEAPISTKLYRLTYCNKDVPCNLFVPCPEIIIKANDKKQGVILKRSN